MKEENKTNFNTRNISSVNEKSISPLKGSVFLREEGGLKIYRYPTYEFDQEERKKSKKIILLGGIVKVSLINSFVNFLMDIKYNDNFRYKLIDEKISQNEVNNYNIRTSDGKLYQIIDTPGYRGLAEEKEFSIISMKIKECILYRLDEINAICLCVKSSDIILSDSQKDIFNCIFDLFGEDTKDMLITMITDCEGGKPAVLDSLQDESFIFHNIVKCKNDCLFKFNNSGIFEKDGHSLLDLNTSLDIFKRFTEKLDTLPSVKLDQTKTVINERDKLIRDIEILRIKLFESSNKIEIIKGILKNLEELKNSKPLKTVIKLPKMKKVPTEKGKYMITCLICSKTCYRNNTIKDDDLKFRCSCFNNGYCTVCKNKCHWTEHKNRPYELVEYVDEEVVILNDLEKNLKIKTQTQILMGSLNDLKKLNLHCNQIHQEIIKRKKRLKEITLNKSSLEYLEEFLDEIIIKKEKSDNSFIELLFEVLKIEKKI